MPQINDIRELAQQNARYVSNSPQDWMSYLDVAARLYRYSFTDTLLIHAQRPDATACAELELWNQKMSRWVNRGAKGIALLDDTGPRIRLRYVFDIADTHLVRGGRTPLLWNLDSHEHEQTILDHLADTYGLSQTDSMNTALMELAQQLTADNLDEAMDGLAYEVADTFLEELDEDNIRVRFRELMTNSIFYTLSRRCGQEPMDVLDDDDFIRIVDFNKLPVLSFLGNAVSEQCEAVLFDIGREMRKIYKKEITQQLEKSVDSLYNTNTDFSTLKREIKENTTKGGQENGVDVLPQGRLSVPESGREGRAADYREVRDAAQDVPEREPQELVSEYADERQAEPASGADRGSSGEPGGNPAGQSEREVSGTEQGERPAGMGGTSEQTDGDGRRNRLEGIGIQLTEPTTEQDLSEAEEEIASAFSFPDLPTVEQQIRAIEAPIRARYADEIALDPEVVDEILRTGSNRSKGQLRLMNELNLPTPGLYAKRKNLLMGSNPIIAPDSEMLWNAAIVWRILRRYEYTGALVMGRRKKIDVNTTSVRTLPEDKWIIAENAHAAIVTKDEYYQAQKAIRNVTPIQYKVGDDFALKGKICCGNCNRQLRHERQYGEMVFYCGYKRSAGKFSKCYGGYYREYSVNAKVARAIKTVFYALDVVNQGMQEKQSITVRCMDIEDLEKQAEAIRVEQIKLYESYADGVLLRDAYIEKKKALSEKLAALQDSIRTEKEEQECADELDEEIRALTKQASEKTYIGGLTKECVDAFVSMVYLYDDQTMKIEFNCEDVIRRALEKYGA